MRVRKTICVALAALLALSPFSVAARAEESSKVRAQAQRQNERLQELVDELEQGRAEVDQLNQQIDDLAEQSIALQGALIEDRQNLATTVATTYRTGMPSMLDMLLASKDVEDFVANMYYAQKVADWQTERISQLKADKLELEQTMERIEDSRNERGLVLDVLDTTRAALQNNIDALYARAATLEEEERKAEEERLAQIARQAQLEEERRKEEEAKRQAAAEAARQEEARLEAERQAAKEQEARDEAARQEAEAQAQAEAERKAAEEQAAAERAAQEQAAQEQAAPDPEQEPVDTSSASDWITCIASAYTIADNDPPGSTATASGVPLDDSIPTVAMPMSMDPARFYGSRIQIEYEGMAVIATVTDCGYMAGGARGLDLSTAVFRAFGFTTADDWGLREVRYRFL